MSILCKFKCTNLQSHVDHDGAVNRKEAQFEPVVGGSDENLSFSKQTPTGSLTLQVTNPDVFDAFVVGGEYYLTIRSASEKGLDSTPAPQKKVEFVPTPSPKPPGEAGIRTGEDQRGPSQVKPLASDQKQAVPLPVAKPSILPPASSSQPQTKPQS